MRRVRSDIIIRRFLDGWTILDLNTGSGWSIDDIEQEIRDALNRKPTHGKRGKRSKRV